MPKDALAFDRSASVRSYDSDGHLHIESANISKATVNPYFGKEIPGGGKDLEPEKVYKLLRDPKELLKAAPTFAGKPILIQHTPISADDHPHDQVIGSVGTDVKFDSPFLTAPLTIWDGDAIALIESGKQRALSSGYRYSVDWTPGTFSGQSYDGVMRNIEANHLALVVEGRAGPDVIVGDSKPKEDISPPNVETSNMAKAALKAFDADPADPKMDPETAKFPPDKEKPVAKDAEGEPDTEESDVSAAVEAAYEEGYKDGCEDGEEMSGRDRAARDKRATDRRMKRGVDKTAPANDADPDDKSDQVFKPKEKEEKNQKAQDRMISQTAMDAAITSAAKLAEKNITTRMKEAREAERFVRPWVGELAVAYDTGEEILRASAVSLGVPDAATIHVSALKAMIGMMPKPGERSNVTRLAADSGVRATAAADEFAKMFPTARAPRSM